MSLLSDILARTQALQEETQKTQRPRYLFGGSRVMLPQSQPVEQSSIIQQMLASQAEGDARMRQSSGDYSEAKLREQQGHGLATTEDAYSDARLRDQLGLPPAGMKPDRPLENFLGSVDSQESYRTAMMQYMASGGRRPKWYTGNYEADKGNIDAAIGATMTPMQQMQRAEAAQRNQDLEEARLARIELAKKVEERRSQQAALAREGMATKPAIPKRDERIQALNVLGGVLGEGFDKMSQREQDAAATRAASIAKQNKMSEENKDVDFESLLQDAYNDMIAKGELKLPQEGTGLRGWFGIGQEAKPAGFSPKGSMPQDQAPQNPSAPSAPAKVQSRADYDALPVGALYVHPNGKTYRKK